MIELWVKGVVTITPLPNVKEFGLKVTEAERCWYPDKYLRAIEWLRSADIKITTPLVSSPWDYVKPKEMIKCVSIKTNIKCLNDNCYANIGVKTGDKYNALLSLLFNLDDKENYVIYISSSGKWNYSLLYAGILALKTILNENADIISKILRSR